MHAHGTHAYARIQVRLVLSRAIHIHFSFSAYSITSYLYTPLARAARSNECTAQSLRLPRLACTLSADLLPSLLPPPADDAGGKKKRKASGSGNPPAPKPRRMAAATPASDDSDFDMEGEPNAPAPRTRALAPVVGKGRTTPLRPVAPVGAAATAREVVILDDSD